MSIMLDLAALIGECLPGCGLWQHRCHEEG